MSTDDKKYTAESFVEAAWPHAVRVGDRLGVDPRAIIAQAAHESAWGNSAPGGNLFGIKAHGAKNTVSVKTHEYVDGQRENVTDDFRAYDNMGASFDGYADFLESNPRYADTLRNGADASAYFTGLSQAGYATDPEYANKLTAVFESVSRRAPEGYSPAPVPTVASTQPLRVDSKPPEASPAAAPGPILPKPGDQIDPPDALREGLPLAPTDAEIAEATAEPDDIPFWDAVAAAYKNDSSVGAYQRYTLGSRFDPDLEFDVASAISEQQDRIDALNMGDSEELGDYLGDAVSADHFEFLLKEGEAELGREAFLAQNGGEALGARMVAALGDPAEWAALAFTGGFSAAAKVGRTGYIIRQAASGVAAGVAVEGSVASQSHVRDGTDVAIAATFAGLLGTGTGWMGGTLAHRAQKAAERDLNNLLDSAGAQRRVLDGGTGNPLAPSAQESSAATLDMFDAGATDFRFESLQKLQQNYQGRLFFSDDTEVRQLGSRMLEGGHIRDKTKARGWTAELEANNIQRVFLTGLMRDSKKPFDDWAARNGYGKLRQMFGTKAHEEFYADVGDALRGVDTASPEAQSAAASMRKHIDSIHDMAREAGVKGFDAEKVENYFPRMHAREKWLKLNDEIGEDGMINWWREAILAEADDMAEETAEKIAKGYVRAVTRRSAGMDQNLTHGIPLEDMDRLREVLGDIDDPGEKALIDDVITSVEQWKADRAKRTGSGADVRHGKHRLLIAEDYKGMVKGRDGNVREVALRDMVESDAFKVLSRYSRVMAGHIGLAKHADIKSQADFQNVIKAIKDRGVQNGRVDKAINETEALTDAYKLLTGQSIEENPFSATSQFVRSLLSFNFLRFGGGFGIAQLPEFGNVIAEAGILGFIKMIPEFRGILKRARNGQLDNEFARDLEEMFAPGTDFIRNPAVSNFDEFGIGFTESGMGKFLRKIDPALQTGGRSTAALSLMAPINAAMQRMAAMSWSKRIARLAAKDKLSDADIARLRSAGIKPRQQRHILNGIKKYGKYKADGTLVGIDYKAWRKASPSSAKDFELAGLRAMRQLVQENDIANTGRAIHRPVGKVLFQFMTFMFNSVNKQLLHGVHHSDIQAFVSVSTGMFLASMAYTGQTYVNHAGDPKKLEEMLTAKKIAAAGFARSGAFAAAVPVADMASFMLGFDPMFAHSRTSGLGTRFISANPSLTLANDIPAAISSITGLLHGDAEFTRSDFTRMQRLTPYHRILGVQTAWNALGHAITDE